MNRNLHNPSQNQSPSSDESGPLPFGNFDDFSHDSEFSDHPETDDRLVAFLRQHQPIAPPEPVDFETDLMAAIAQETAPVTAPVAFTVRPVAQPEIRPAKRWPKVVGAIAAGLVGAVLGHNLGAWTNPSGMQFADSGRGTPSETELEAFLEEGWDIAHATSTDFSAFDWDTTSDM